MKGDVKIELSPLHYEFDFRMQRLTFPKTSFTAKPTA